MTGFATYSFPFPVLLLYAQDLRTSDPWSATLRLLHDTLSASKRMREGF